MTPQKTLRSKARRLGQNIGEEFFHAAQCGECPICGQTIRLGVEAISYDHVFPLNPEGGSQNLHQGNLLLTHEKCNRKKGNRLPTNGEVAILEMVNTILGFEHADGTYRRSRTNRRQIVRRIEQIKLVIVDLEHKIQTADRQVYYPETVHLAATVAQLTSLEAELADQETVFSTYRYIYDLAD